MHPQRRGRRPGSSLLDRCARDWATTIPFFVLAITSFGLDLRHSLSVNADGSEQLRASHTMVLFYCDLFWIALLVTMFSGGTHFVMHNGGESEPSSLKPNMNLRARVNRG